MESLTSGTMAGTGSFRCRACGYVLTLRGTDRLTDCPGCGGRDFARASLFSAGSAPGRGRLAGAASTPVAARPQFAGKASPAAGLVRQGGAVRRGPGEADGTGDAEQRLNPNADDAGAGAGEPPHQADTLNAGLVGDGILARPEPVDDEAWLQRARARLHEPGEYLAYEDGSELRTVPLTREWTRIGRSLAADLRFDDPTVSRRHALIVRQADGVHVLDDRSLNGVFVNGSRIEGSGIAQRALQDGDEIVVGRYRLRFVRVPV